MIQAIFYARFFSQEGTKIAAQAPPGCIVPEPGVVKPPLLDFSIMSAYIIPRKAFYNRFMTVCDPEGKYAVLGFPVSIPSSHYVRNEFIFNFGLVVEANIDYGPYERVVRRLAATFAEMEKQDSFLSWDENNSPSGRAGNSNTSSSNTNAAITEGVSRIGARRPIASLLEIVKEDLNLYGECLIPIDEATVINMKLFPRHAAPPEVKGWHVPVARMRLADLVDPTWDLTLQRLVPHIDGVADVRRIAWLADVALPLACAAVRHLVYYDAVLLLDMFFFGSCYAPRPGIHDFVANVGGMLDECASYVCVVPEKWPGGGGGKGGGGGRGGGGGGGGGGVNGNEGGDGDGPGSRGMAGSQESSDRTRASMGDGRLPLKSPGDESEAGLGTSRGGGSGGGGGGTFITQRPRVSNYTLIKLMTTFCVGKTVMEWLKGHMDNGLDVLGQVDVRRLVQFGVIKGCLYRVHKYVVSKQYLAALATGQARPVATTTTTTGGGRASAGDPLQRYTDGRHCFDQIITEQNMTDAEIMERLKTFPGPSNDLTVLFR